MDQSILSRLIASRSLSLISGILLSAVWGLFAYNHFVAFVNKGDIALLLFVVVETLAASFFLLRSTPKYVSVNPLDWIVAVMGTLTAMFFSPSDSGILPSASSAIALGIILQIFALASLNRSFALVAAVRSVKTDKMYQFVRHPIYLSYCITFTAYVLAYTSYSNLIVYAVVMILMVLRIFREERQLSQEPSYREYMGRVRYRLIPFVF